MGPEVLGHNPGKTVTAKRQICRCSAPCSCMGFGDGLDVSSVQEPGPFFVVSLVDAHRSRSRWEATACRQQNTILIEADPPPTPKPPCTAASHDESEASNIFQAALNADHKISIKVRGPVRSPLASTAESNGNQGAQTPTPELVRRLSFPNMIQDSLSSQGAQYPLIKEHTLNDIGICSMI